MTTLEIIGWAKAAIRTEAEAVNKQWKAEYRKDPDSDLVEDLVSKELTLNRKLTYLDNLAMVLSSAPDND